MKLTHKDVEELKTILAACKVIGVDGVVIHEGKARGAKPSLDAAILSEAKLSISEALRIGIGRVSELEKRLAIFQDQVEIEGKSNEAGDVSLLTLSANKTKVQFRCTSVNLMRYPKENQDSPLVIITFPRAEVLQISKAVKTLGAETVVLQVSRNGVIKLECADSSNDRFNIELSTTAEFVDDADGIVQTYLADLFISLLEASAQAGDASLVLGHEGSITATAKGHTLIIFPQITQDA